MRRVTSAATAIVFGLVCFDGATSLRAAPTSAPSVVPADWVSQDHSDKHLTFSVPPTWKAGDHTEESFYFLLPTSSRMSEDRVLVEMHPSKSDSLTALVETARQKIKSEGTAAKLLRDATDTLAGQPAWVLLSEKNYTNTAAEAVKPAAKPANGKLMAAAKPAPSRRLKTYQEFCIVGDMQYAFTFTSDGATYEQQFPSLKKVLTSVKLGDAPAAPAVADATAKGDAANETAPAPTGWITVSQQASHFEFSVPISWKKQIETASQYTFVLPRFKTFGGDQLTMSFGQCHAIPLKQMADESRANLVKDPDTKLERDEQITLGGRPAWILVANHVHKYPNNGPGPANAKYRPGKLYDVLTIDKDWMLEMILDVDAGATEQGLAITKLIESFKWTAPPRDPAMVTESPTAPTPVKN